MPKLLARDLIKGKLYETDGGAVGHRVEGLSTVLFLGRVPDRVKGKYIWLYIGCVSVAKCEEDIYALINRSDSKPYINPLTVHSVYRGVYDFKHYSQLNSFRFDINSPFLDKRIRCKILDCLAELGYNV